MPEKNIVYASPLLAAALIDKSMGPFEHLVWSNNDDYSGENYSEHLKKNKAVQKMISDWSDENFKDQDNYINFLLSDKTNGKENYFTDDTMLTMAVAYTLNSDKYRAVFEEIKNKNITDEEKLRGYYRQLDEDLFVNFCKFSRRYPKCFGECGAAFQMLVIELSENNNKYMSDDEIRKVYRAKKEKVRNKKYKGYDTKSWGNGSAMRVSSCAYVANSLTEARVLAELSAINTHESELAIKSAQAVASFIYLARLGLDKKTIKAYMNYMYRTESPVCISGDPAESFITSWDFDNLTIDKIKAKGYPYCIRADLTVIPAIVAVLEADNYLDACKLVSELGADSDTMGLITASMAAALYGTPEILVQEGKDLLNEIQHNPDVVITSPEDNLGTEDNFMSKINEDFDKNFSSGYRGNADKNWQLNQINQILVDLENYKIKPHEINETKKQEFEKLVGLMEGDKIEIKDKIEDAKEENNGDKNKFEIQGENKLLDSILGYSLNEYGDKNKESKKVPNENPIENVENKKAVGLAILRRINRKLYDIEKNINTKDKEKKLDEVVCMLICFADNFDTGLSTKEKENLIKEIKSKKDVSWFTILIEKMKVFFRDGRSINSKEIKIIVPKQRLNETREVLKQFFIDKNNKNKKDGHEKTEDENRNKNKTKEIRKDKDRE